MRCHPDVPAHNNFVEQQIKHYATGRKCWYFCYDKVGAQCQCQPVFTGDDVPY